MNANENRKYMEAIREMVNHKGGFKVKEVLKSHGVPTTCDQVLRRLNWTKGMGGPHGSTWIHAKPHNEAELWGRIMCILAGPAIIGTWVLGTWMNFKRYWV